MKALSLWQPWASHIAEGRKKIETRHWATGYRGPILIHAAKRTSECDDEEKRTLPFGAIICRAVLTDCVRTEELRDKITDDEYGLGNYGPGRFGWMLRDVVAFPTPIPFKGAQGLFDVPDHVLLAAHVSCGECDVSPVIPLASCLCKCHARKSIESIFTAPATEKKDDGRVYTFSQGSEYADWENDNCGNCWKGSMTGKRYNCPLQKALWEAFWGDGKVKKEIADRMGYPKSWDCLEREAQRPPRQRRAPALENTPLFGGQRLD